MNPIYEQFLKYFQAENLEGCRQIINQPEFDVNHIFTQNELKTRLQNFPVTNSTITLNVLHLIARLGKQWSTELIMSILESKRSIDIDFKNKEGWTALMMAACHSNATSSLEIVELLIRVGANLDLQEEGGYTALMFAARDSMTNSSLKTVELLISSGANLCLKNNNGATALVVSRSSYSSSQETIKMLSLNATKDDLLKDKRFTALMDPIYEQFLKYFREENLDGCRHVINQPEFDISRIFTPVELKMKLQNLPVMSSNYTLNVLQLIARVGKRWSTALIQSILELERDGSVVVDLDLPNKEGWTALMMAAYYSNTTSSLETVELLIRAGANLDLQNNNGWTALMYASHYSRTSSSLETVETLIQAGANLDLQCTYGRTALIFASQYSNDTSSLETVELLIRGDAKLDLQSKEGWTALILAAKYSNNKSSLETVELLIRAGANLDLQTKDGYTALMYAARYSKTKSSLETVELLIRAGANLDLQTTTTGSTALLLAAQNSPNCSSIETVLTLISAGSKFDLHQRKN